MTVTNKRLVEILTTAMEKPEIANALIQRVINTLDKQEREWQGLRNEEIDWLWGLAFEAKLDNMPRHFARMVEEKLKEKNT